MKLYPMFFFLFKMNNFGLKTKLPGYKFSRTELKRLTKDLIWWMVMYTTQIPLSDSDVYIFFFIFMISEFSSPSTYRKLQSFFFTFCRKLYFKKFKLNGRSELSKLFFLIYFILYKFYQFREKKWFYGLLERKL